MRVAIHKVRPPFAALVALGLAVSGGVATASQSDQATEDATVTEINGESDVQPVAPPAELTGEQVPASKVQQIRAAEEREATVAPTSNHGCADFYSCFWTNTFFSGDKVRVHRSVPKQQWIPISGTFLHSAKNRYGNRLVRAANPLYITACLNPKGHAWQNVGDMPPTDRMLIGSLGSRCNNPGPA